MQLLCELFALCAYLDLLKCETVLCFCDVRGLLVTVFLPHSDYQCLCLSWTSFSLDTSACDIFLGTPVTVLVSVHSPDHQ